MASNKSMTSIIIVVAVVLFIAAFLLTLYSSVGFWLALIWNVMSALDIYYDFIRIGTINSTYIAIADALDSIVFVLITFYLASWFYGVVRSVSIEEKLSLSKIRRMKGHIIVAPYNSLAGFMIKDAREAVIPVVVITGRQDELARIRRDGAVPLLGSAGSTDTFVAAGINNASCVVAGSDDATKNALISVTAKSAYRKAMIIARAKRIEDIAKISKSGVYRVIIPESSAGGMIGDEILKRVFDK